MKGGFLLQEYNIDKLAETFNRVALYYNIITPLFARPYRRAVEYVLRLFNGSGSPPRVLDIGTGTGMLAGAFAARGAVVTGVDISPGMLGRARRKYGSRVNFIQAPAHAPGDFEDNSFDVVTAGFVLHEMPADYRLRVLKEMKRLSGGFVVVLDYVPNWNPVVSLVERIEGSFYREFLAGVEKQLDEVFSRHETRRLSHFIGMYLCSARD
jgi:ubiquinone/menaquinone biosynthesis C-methylase UbiE